jgi:hypothetical protein
LQNRPLLTEVQLLLYFLEVTIAPTSSITMLAPTPSAPNSNISQSIPVSTSHTNGPEAALFIGTCSAVVIRRFQYAQGISYTVYAFHPLSEDLKDNMQVSVLEFS